MKRYLTQPELVKQELLRLGIGHAQLSLKMGFSLTTVNLVLKGNRQITKAFVEKFEIALDQLTDSDYSFLISLMEL